MSYMYLPELSVEEFCCDEVRAWDMTEDTTAQNDCSEGEGVEGEGVEGEGVDIAVVSIIQCQLWCCPECVSEGARVVWSSGSHADWGQG